MKKQKLALIISVAMVLNLTTNINTKIGNIALADTWQAVNFVKVSQKSSSGKVAQMYVDNLKVYDFEKDFGNAKLKSISLNTTAAAININETIKLDPIFDPSDAANKNVKWKSSNETVASVDDNGVVTGLNAGKSKIMVTAEDGGITTSCAITVNGVVNIPVQDISLEKKFEIEKGEKKALEVKILPDNASNKKIKWESSKPNIVSIDENGVITALEKGAATITATSEEGGKTAKCNVEVKYLLNTPQLDDIEYQKIRENIFNEITGGKIDLNDKEIQNVIEKMVASAQTTKDSMNKNSAKPYLWSDQANFAKSATITNNYKKIETMAKAYAMEGSSLKGNKELLDSIIYAMDWMYKNKFNENLNTEYDNWWDWEIGTPVYLNNICILLYDELKGERLDNYMKAVYFYQPDPFHSGYTGLHPNPYRESEAANRVDVAKIALYMGALTNNYEQILMAKDAACSVLEYVDTLDGFYRDGSFIQHGTVPYVGTYGNVFINGTGILVGVLKDSQWEIPQNNLNNLYNFVTDSFEPFIYKGAALDMVRGRGISRYNELDRNSGHAILNSMVMLSRFAEEPYASHFKSIAKYWMQVDTVRDHVSNLGNLGLIRDCKNILNDDNVSPEVPGNLHRNYPMMDRVIHRTSDYLFGVSMFSSRITNFECMNNENKRGWYTSQGMTYLYNNDLEEYTTDFWSTVNPYRLPGTTVDTIKMENGKGQKALSNKDWVGGTTLGNYGINGMEIVGLAPNKTFTSLEGKKSWFMFDDEIVALGAGINSTDNRTIESIVENRKLKDNSNSFTVDGEDKASQIGVEEDLINAKWAHLSGNVKGADIGYYFPKADNLKAKRVQNIGTWQDIGSSGPVDENKKPVSISRNYLEMWFDHGSNPKDASYEYVLLPNKSKDEVKAYAENPQVTVLKNSSEVQAVKHNKLNIIGANFFTDTAQTVEGITVKGKASVMVKEEQGEIELSISDPTMKNNGTIEVELDKKDLSAVSLDSEIKVIQLAPTLKLSVNVKGTKGKSIKAKFKKDKNSLEDKKIKAELESNMNSLVANETINLKANITNNGNENKTIMVIAALYNKDNVMENVKYVSKEVNSNEKIPYELDLKLPNNIEGYKVKVFFWEGKDLKETDLNSIDDAIEINNI